MKNPFRKKRGIYDYQTCLVGLADDLEKLRDHILQHDFYVGNDKDVVDLTYCVNIIRTLDTWDDEAWDHLFKYMKENMRKWWC